VSIEKTVTGKNGNMAVLSVEERGKQSLKKYQDEVDIGNLNGIFESAYGFKNQRKAFLNFTNILFCFYFGGNNNLSSNFSRNLVNNSKNTH
jgi:hypothetical protein